MVMNIGQANASIARLQAKRDQMDADRNTEADSLTGVNAIRLRSLNHYTEKANGKECCVKCTIHYDDDGLVVGATHYRLRLEDKVVSPTSTLDGLRSRLMKGTATLDAQGSLSIDGQPV